MEQRRTHPCWWDARLSQGCAKAQVVSGEQVQKGFRRLVAAAPDLRLDVPSAPEQLATFVARAVVDGALPAAFVDDLPAGAPLPRLNTLRAQGCARRCRGGPARRVCGRPPGGWSSPLLKPLQRGWALWQCPGRCGSLSCAPSHHWGGQWRWTCETGAHIAGCQSRGVLRSFCLCGTRSCTPCRVRACTFAAGLTRARVWDARVGSRLGRVSRSP